MNTLDQYFPTMQEGTGRFYFPAKSAIGTVVASVLLIGAVFYAATYPAMKAKEAVAQLVTYNNLTTTTVQAAQGVLGQVQPLLASAPKWLQDTATKRTGALQAQLAKAKPVTPDEVLQASEKQQVAYMKAQALIAASPFKELQPADVPQSPAGQAYLRALQITPPARFQYQRLTDGESLALTAYKAALAVQVGAEQWLHQVDVQVNGKKAAPLGAVAAAADSPVAVSSSPAGSAHTEFGSSSAALAAMLAASQHDSPQTASDPASPADVPMDTSDATPNTQAAPDPLAMAAAKAKAEQEHQQAEAQAAVARAKADAERKKQEAAYTAQQAKWKAEQQQQQAAYQARQAVNAKADQERKAQAVAAEKEREAKAAAAAKARQCTSNLVARIACTAQGYNPLTGEKRSGH